MRSNNPINKCLFKQLFKFNYKLSQMIMEFSFLQITPKVKTKNRCEEDLMTAGVQIGR